MNMFLYKEHECYYHWGLPPTLSLFHVPEVSCFRELLVQLSAHLPPHLSLLAQPRLQLGSQVVTGLGERVWLTRCQTYMVQHALWAGHPLQVQVTPPVDGHVLIHVFIWRNRGESGVHLYVYSTSFSAMTEACELLSFNMYQCCPRNH